MKRLEYVSIVILLFGIVMTTGAWAQETHFSVQFADTPLSQVLASLQRLDPTLQYALSSDLANITVTASLIDMTVQSALKVVMAQAGLVAVDDGGIYQIRRQNQPAQTRVSRPAVRQTPPWFTLRPAETISAATALPVSPQAPATGTAAEQKKSLPLRLIIVKHADPADLAWLFGGQVVEGGGLYAGGSGNGSGYSNGDNNGNGGNGRNNNSNGYSNNSYGNSGNSRSGSNRNSGSSRNSRSSGSNNYY